MHNLNRVVWSRGMFLMPQHLQVTDRCNDSVLRFTLGATTFEPWGFTQLAIDSESLKTGFLQLNRCEGIFPDGTLFSAPESDSVPPSRNIGVSFSPTADSLSAYVGIPVESVKSAFASPESEQSRYRTAVVDIHDESTGKDEKPVQLAYRNLKLAFENDAGVWDSHILIPVVKIRRNNVGAFENDSNFVPPCLNIAVSDYLMNIVKRLLELLVSARRRLVEGSTLAESPSADLIRRIVLRDLNGLIPQLNHIFAVRRGHPEFVFRFLLQIPGLLSLGMKDYNPADLPAYEHADPGTCFARLSQKVQELLARIE